MRVLLTGNEGYIGTILVPLLWATGHEVVGLDSGLFRECTLAGGPRGADHPQGHPRRRARAISTASTR